MRLVQLALSSFRLVNPVAENGLHRAADKENINENIVEVFEEPLQRSFFWGALGAGLGARL
jgi:hypothetical protein